MKKKRKNIPLFLLLGTISSMVVCKYEIIDAVSEEPLSTGEMGLWALNLIFTIISIFIVFKLSNK